jgi:hypothetical protein
MPTNAYNTTTRLFSDVLCYAGDLNAFRTDLLADAAQAVAGGTVSLTRLSDGGAVSGYVLTYDGTHWVPGAAPGGGGSPYVLPSATTSTLGGVRPDGSTVQTSSGVLSVVRPLPTGTSGSLVTLGSGGTPATLGIGSSGQVLTVSGSSLAWATPAAGATYQESNYTASGAINPADDYATFTGSGTYSMTVANGTVAGHEIKLKQLGGATVNVTANMDGSSRTLTLFAAGAGGGGSSFNDYLTLKWSAVRNTYGVF